MINWTIPIPYQANWSKKYVVRVVEMLSSNNKHATQPFFGVISSPLCLPLE